MQNESNAKRVDEVLATFKMRDLDWEVERDYYAEELRLEAKLGRFHNGRS